MTAGLPAAKIHRDQYRGLEALPPNTLASLLTSAIEVNLDPELLARAREAGAQELRQIARALPSGS
jgi:hypothetical protein